MPWLEPLQPVEWGRAIGIVAGAYVLGCFTTGYYLVRWWAGQDLRRVGSGSLGARNAGRALGWKGFLLTALGDFAKGVFAVMAAEHFTMDGRLVVLALLAVVAGHVWPLQLGFRGGKGVATSLGALLAWDYHLAIAFAILFCITAGALRRTVLPALLAFALLPVVGMYWGHEAAKAVGATLLAGVILIAHRKNLIEEFSRLIPHRNLHPEHDQN